LGKVRRGQAVKGMPNPNDVPEEMRPYISEMEEIGAILGPITRTKPVKQTKAPPPPPKKEYTVNHQTVFQQWPKEVSQSSTTREFSTTRDSSTETTNPKTISFNMSKVLLPSLIQKQE
jgi:hypothetical protein